MFAHILLTLEGALIAADFRREVSARYNGHKIPGRHVAYPHISIVSQPIIDVEEINDWHLRALRLGWIPSGRGWLH